MKIKCAIYARVSTDQQGDSIENQVSQATEYINRLGDNYDTDDITIYKDEAVSGYYTSVFNRAAMKKAIVDARNNKFKLLVFKEISRVGRDKQENPAIIGIFEQYGVRVIAINDNYDSLNKDNITFDIISVLSEQESKKISSRVSSARKQKALRGQWGGDPPIGYKINKNTKRLEIDEDTKEIPMIIFDLYVNKKIGCFKISETLNKKGFRTSRGNIWSRESVKRIIKNQAYIGNVIYGTKRNELKREYDDTGKMTKRKVQIRTKKEDWIVVEDAHPPIIDDKTFHEAQIIISERNHHRKPRRAYHPLTGILFCEKCGQGMVCQKRSAKNKEYRYYICKTYHKYGRSFCNQANVNADKLEEQLLNQLKSELSRLPEDYFDIKVQKQSDVDVLNDEIKSKEKLKEKFQRDQRDVFEQRDLFTDEVYREQMLDIKNKIEHIDEEILLLQNKKESLADQSEDMERYRKIVQDALRLNVEDKDNLRSVFHSIIDKISIKGTMVDVKYKFHFFS